MLYTRREKLFKCTIIIKKKKLNRSNSLGTMSNTKIQLLKIQSSIFNSTIVESAGNFKRCVKISISLIAYFRSYDKKPTQILLKSYFP